MELVGVEIRNFRSIGNEPVVISPMEKCNILIGKNNVGKSNIINAFIRIASIIPLHKNAEKLKDLEKHMSSDDQLFGCRLIFQADNNDSIFEATKMYDFYFDFTEKPNTNGIHIVDNTFAHINDTNRFMKIGKLVGRGISDRASTAQQWFLNDGGEIIFRQFASSLPKLQLIPQFRQIQDGDQYSFAGVNIIAELGRYQNPYPNMRHERKKFDKINDLLCKLLHMEAQLEVTFDNKQILITANGQTLPLESYGTGVHELIILATAILSIDDPRTICCIEEPEIHLHPSLQREFIQFITEQTHIRYLISTHSPTLINVQATMPPSTQHKVQVFHLVLENGATVGGPVLEDDHALYALNDLGVRASDILQSNCVIWVEGPSDRIYLNRWIELLEPDLIEGLHYSIMFYGGVLLSHLGVQRQNGEKVPEELIDLLKINQNAAVIIDSDRPQKGKNLSSTKLRIRTECDETESLCWITDGREIENYLSEELVSEVFSNLSNKKIVFQQDDYERFEDRLDNSLQVAKAKAVNYANNKVKFARIIAENYEEHHIDDDLRKQLNGLIDKIIEWNK